MPRSRTRASAPGLTGSRSDPARGKAGPGTSSSPRELGVPEHNDLGERLELRWSGQLNSPGLVSVPIEG